MRVKRYVVDTMPEAMMQIRGDFGTDAVILSTKEMKIGGFMGMFGKKKIEVVAAVEEQQLQKPRRVQPSQQQSVEAFPSMSAPEQQEVPSSPVVPRQAAPEAYRRVTQMTNGSKEGLADLLAGSEQAASSMERSSYGAGYSVETENEALNNKAAVPKKETSDELFKLPSEASVPDKIGAEENQALLNELREMKAMMTRFSRNSVMENTWYRNRYKRFVSVCWSRKWNAICWSIGLNGYMSAEVSIRLILNLLIGNMLFVQKWSGFIRERLDKGISKDTKIVYVAGPTGVGKTTTIAKLAAEQLFKHQRKVGFITSDTYRISAVEQLRTYATILNVPLEVVQSPGDVHRAIQRLEHCDLILMDTAGRNYRNELLVSELQSLLSPIKESETYLVLSLTSKSKDMLNITGHFSKFGLGKVVFTKMDETGSCGGMFNLLHQFPMQLAYITNGQNVPDDLLHPDTEMVTNLLFGTTESSGDTEDSV